MARWDDESHVFISYIRADAPKVDRLADELRRYGVVVWIDREQLKPGQFWKTAIRTAIADGIFLSSLLL